MSSMTGENIKISLFGQSHGSAIGVVMDGLPPGEEIDLHALQLFLNRRAPGRGELSTARNERDVVRILSGLVNGRTCGAPLCAIIENTDARSSDYAAFSDMPRPSHADYPAHVRYKGYADLRGGGHFSGRLTAPLCIAGGICMQILSRRGVFVGAHAEAVGSIKDRRFDPVFLDKEELLAPGKRPIPVLEERAGEEMAKLIKAVSEEGDSIGGVIECAATGMPPGIGEPMFGGLENRLAAAVFAIPAVRGVEFGAGFAAAHMHGSEHNDAYCVKDGAVKTTGNHHGGILGGITTGMPIVFRAAIKPTPSIAKAQQSIRLSTMKEDTLLIKGRHDPCIALRAVPCVEAAAAFVLLDSYVTKMAAPLL
ncbi:chorismate synthase [Christensenellaceae bacterium OttesenSCG-928-M15]|nr:chorismate synthase [Christensenellaceae bacterium OttesenSCG-928-M15]